MKDEQPFYINMPRYLELSKKTKKTHASVVALDLITVLCGGQLTAFEYNEDRAAEAIARVFENRPMTAKELRSMRRHLLHFFVELPDGRWVPSPDVFSAIDGNPGSAS